MRTFCRVRSSGSVVGRTDGAEAEGRRPGNAYEGEQDAPARCTRVCVFVRACSCGLLFCFCPFVLVCQLQTQLWWPRNLLQLWVPVATRAIPLKTTAIRLINRIHTHTRPLLCQSMKRFRTSLCRRTFHKNCLLLWCRTRCRHPSVTTTRARLWWSRSRTVRNLVVRNWRAKHNKGLKERRATDF